MPTADVHLSFYLSWPLLMLSCLLALTWVKTNQPNKNIYPQKNICLHLWVAPRPHPALSLINTAAGPSLRCFHVSLLLTTNVTLTFFRFTSYFAKQSIFYQYMFSNNESFSTVTSKVLLYSLASTSTPLSVISSTHCIILSENISCLTQKYFNIISHINFIWAHLYTTFEIISRLSWKKRNMKS